MKPSEEIPGEVCRDLVGIFFDIDDTFSLHGKIRAEAFSSLWDACRAGLCLIPITGRPAGWADHIARMWPVNGVVGENGAFYFWMDRDAGRLRKRFFLEDGEARGRNRKRLAEIFAELQERFPGIGLASDQPYREADIAVDFCEDVSPPLPLESAAEIRAFFEARGARAKVSSIHVNAWFGDYDKLSMCRRFAEERLDVSLEREKNRFLFIGDSPNDCPMFSFFPWSAGVAGVQRFLGSGLLLPPPRFVSSLDGSLGFEQIVRHVLSFRSQ
jgi:HAD superfamily hydrolase (TIGR01484 family)